ncbi:MAG TPA: transglycosylase SLT domain-containing protein [Candidatus Saccharimonadales bacterium]|nr:transglycosylase SLT domain-containing protein [Candidatus Saccharimonadales bacterium]
MKPLPQLATTALAAVLLVLNIFSTVPAQAVNSCDRRTISYDRVFYDADCAPVTSGGGGGGEAPDGTQPADFKVRNVALGQQLATPYGWGNGAEFDCLYDLWMKESGWNERADNPTSSAYGIPQALPGKKMASHGSDWRTNPGTQIRWGLDYIKARYKSPCNALTFWKSRKPHWY